MCVTSGPIELIVSAAERNIFGEARSEFVVTE